jgi:broad specificity phosphatase PhoE
LTQYWMMSKNKKDVTTIYVVRHGESESNVYAHENPDKPASQFGEYGSSLTQKGRDQAHKVAKQLKDVPLSAIYASDLSRAKETAEIIAIGRNISVITDSTIRELSFGSHMSKTQKKQIEKALDSLDEKGKLAFKYFPNGESGYDAINRFKKFIEKKIHLHKNKRILIVSHSYVMRTFLVHEGFAAYTEIPSGSIKNGGYFVIETDGDTYNVIKTNGIARNGKYGDDEE